MFPRIEKLKDKHLSATPQICLERATIITKSYKETDGKPAIVRRAEALKKVLEKMTLRIWQDELIVGSLCNQLRSAQVYPEYSWRWIKQELDDFQKRKGDPLYISKEGKSELINLIKYWKGESIEERVSTLISEQAKRGLRAKAITLGGHQTSIGNAIVDYDFVLQNGIKELIRKSNNQLDKLEIANYKDLEKYHYLKAVITVCKAAINFSQRYAELAARLSKTERSTRRKRELNKIAKICQRVPEKPARTFYEALQSLWFIHLIVHLESGPHGICLGRFDQYMYPFYKNDVDNGEITKEEAKELLQCLWIKMSNLIKLRDKFYSQAFAGFPLFQVVTIGGQSNNGKDATNELSYLILDATAEVRVPQPSLSLRYHDNIDEEFLFKACQVVRLGMGWPSFVNDEIIIPKMLARGYTLEEARNYATNCIEPDVPGKSDSRPHSGYVNFAKCLELALNDGIDPETRERLGPATGKPKEFRTFNDLFVAFLRQVKYQANLIRTSYNICELIHREMAPNPFTSALFLDSIKKGKSRQAGGPKYNHSTIFGVGLGTVSDSLAAIKKLVFEDRTLSMGKLMEAIKNDFEGYEKIRQILITKAPKYGNDNDYVDQICEKIVDDFCQEVQEYHNPRGGNYLAELHSVSMHAIFGSVCGATPDGRKAGNFVSEGVSPVQGRDNKGPTATLKSVAKIDHSKVLNGTLLNQKFSAGSLEGRENLRKFASLIKAYFTLGGHHIQFNVISTGTLKKAQERPDKFRNLLVRVAGYSAYFVELTKEVQNDIIARTEHHLS